MGQYKMLDKFSRFMDIRIGDSIAYPWDVQWKYLNFTYTPISFPCFDTVAVSGKAVNKLLYVYDVLTDVKIAAAIYKHDDEFYLATIKPKEAKPLVQSPHVTDRMQDNGKGPS